MKRNARTSSNICIQIYSHKHQRLIKTYLKERQEKMGVEVHRYLRIKKHIRHNSTSVPYKKTL